MTMDYGIFLAPAADSWKVVQRAEQPQVGPAATAGALRVLGPAHGTGDHASSR